jgi:hypothetical protein
MGSAYSPGGNDRVTKSDDQDPLVLLRFANLQPRPRPAPPERALPFYDRHTEWRPRKQNRRQLRRRVIRGG